MASAAVCSQMLVLLLLIHLLLPLFCGGCVWSLFCCAVLSVVSNFTITERAGCFSLIAFCCHVTVSVLCLFLAVLMVGLQCVIEAFPDHTRLFFSKCSQHLDSNKLVYNLQHVFRDRFNKAHSLMTLHVRVNRSIPTGFFTSF